MLSAGESMVTSYPHETRPAALLHRASTRLSGGQDIYCLWLQKKRFLPSFRRKKQCLCGLKSLGPSSVLSSSGSLRYFISPQCCIAANCKRNQELDLPFEGDNQPETPNKPGRKVLLWVVLVPRSSNRTTVQKWNAWRSCWLMAYVWDVSEDERPLWARLRS